MNILWRHLIMLVCLVSVSVAALAGGSRFDIPAQPLPEALKVFAEQAKMQLLYKPDAVSQRMSNEVVGEFDKRAALQLLLKGTGFEVVFSKGNAATVRAASEEHAAHEIGGQMQVAQAAGGAISSAAMNAQDGLSSKQLNPNLDEVVVTGSHLRGAPPAGSRIISVTRADIDDTGFSAAQDALQTLPQNFGGSLNEVQGGVGNFNRGTGVNLRGLGAGTTLTLVNGRRVTASGDNGDFVDLSSIPSTAIDRVEILPDGASAIYGSDAIGGVVNIILRTDYSGAETRARIAGADGGAAETLFSQVAGKSWFSGNVLAGYQYYDRDRLDRSDRDYAASVDYTRFGAADRRTNFSNPANILNNLGVAVFGIPRGQDGTDLQVSELIPGSGNRGEPGESGFLLPENETHSVFLSGSQQVGELTRLHAEGRFSERSFRVQTNAAITQLNVPATNPFYVNPFGGTGMVRVGYSFIDDLGPTVLDGTTESWTAAFGADRQLSFSSSWRIDSWLSYSHERLSSTTTGQFDSVALNAALADPNPATAFNPFGDGSYTNPSTLALIARSQENVGSSNVTEGTVVADGDLFQLPSGTVRMSIGADYRDEGLNSSRSVASDRQISSVFTELSLPLLRGIGSPLVSLSLAGRYEHYSDFGDTFNPRLGVRIAPLQSLNFRGTWGTSFRAPKLIDLDESAAGGLPSVRLQQYLSPTGLVPTTQTVLQISGNNRDLKQETATSWTAGFDWNSDPIWSGFSTSMTYYDIKYDDRIAIPGPISSLTILQQEQLWTEIVDRNVSPADLSILCARVTSGSCTATPPVAAVDIRLRNISALETNGLDLTLSQSLDTSAGRFRLSLNGNHIFSFRQQLSQTSPARELVDTISNPASTRLRALLDWSWRKVRLNGAANYTTDYIDDVNIPNRTVRAWTTVDIGASYQLDAVASALQGITFAIRGVNILDEDPPFASNGLGFDAANSTPIGRFLSAEISKSW